MPANPDLSTGTRAGVAPSLPNSVAIAAVLERIRHLHILVFDEHLGAGQR
jgi:hypothetical protein